MLRYDLLVMKKALWVLVRVAWLAICVVALVNAQKGYEGSSDWKMQEGLAFEMMVCRSHPLSSLPLDWI
jgi:hypothetical protein